MIAIPLLTNAGGSQQWSLKQVDPVTHLRAAPVAETIRLQLRHSTSRGAWAVSLCTRDSADTVAEGREGGDW